MGRSGNTYRSIWIHNFNRGSAESRHRHRQHKQIFACRYTSKYHSRICDPAPFATMRKMMPALSVAFFSKSSAGTLPVTMEAAEKNVGILPRISRFVLPLCTTINMNGCAAFIFTTVIYLMQNHGIELSIWTMLTWIVIATIAAVGNAGVPMGCFFLSASLLASMDIPITLLGIILPFYTIIDMVETALNVWSDTCVTTIVNKKYCEDINTSFRVKLMQL